MRAPTPAIAVLLALAAAPHLAAQYEEPSVAQLFAKSLGAPSELFGWAVAPLGDVNHDGVIDLAVSAPFATSGGRSSAGRVYALSGANGATLWSRNETRTSAILGYSLETTYWDGDAVLDVVAGAPFAEQGRTWVFSGASGATLAELVGPAAASGFGASVATGGDFDGDGELDVLVAAPFLDTPAGTSAGRVYVFEHGASAPWTSIDGPHAGAEFGLGLAFVGNTSPPTDLKGEIVIGYRDGASFFDGFASVHEWNGTSPALRYTVSGVGMGFQLMGDRIDGGGDVNGDGFHDFLVGDMFHSQVDVFSGANGALLGTLDGDGELGGFGTAHFVLDVDGDGLSDIVAGAWKNSSGASNAGKVFVYSGGSGAILRTITSTATQLNLGIDARELGDFNGDGKRDIVVGAYGDGFSGPLAGAALVFSGHLPGPVNGFRPAQRATDPVLADAGGDPTAGPIAGSPIELFNLALDCRNAPAAGPFLVQARLTTRITPLVMNFGWSWIAGPLLFRAVGLQTQNVVTVSPSGIVLPGDPALIGLRYGVQGACGRRFSSALTQTIGR